MVPSRKDKLNTIASGTQIFSAISLSNFGVIPSIPGELLSFSFYILVTIIAGVINMFVRHSTLSANRGSWTGRLFSSSNVNTELKYIILFRASAIYLPFVITNQSLSFSGPTTSLTFSLLLMYAKKLLLSCLIFAANLRSKLRLDSNLVCRLFQSILVLSIVLNFPCAFVSFPQPVFISNHLHGFP